MSHPFELGLPPQRYDTSNTLDASNTGSKVLTTTPDELASSIFQGNLGGVFAAVFGKEVDESFDKTVSFGLAEVDNLK